ncbi:MAG: hypothetical protein LBR60_04530 [Fibrobacter sp.]|jgi:hypothetical protein|nr:hypothetical protein [Fibrobacter sp.]
MKKLTVIFFAVSLVSLMLACRQEDLTPQMQRAAAPAKAKVTMVEVPSFTAPASPVIDSLKAANYKKASLALLALGEQWSETLEKSSDEERIQILEVYEKARDQVCAKSGLAGMAEFTWLTDVALPAEENKAVLAAAGVSAVE